MSYHNECAFPLFKNIHIMLIKTVLSSTDVDECTLGIHNCSHTCVNTVGYYKCDCPTGYILKDVKRKNCKGMYRVWNGINKK